MDYYILVINPGSTSTKVAIYENESEIISGNIEHPAEELERFDSIVDQHEYRTAAIKGFLEEKKFDTKSFSAVVGRGGLFKPLESGVYRVNEAMLADIREGRMQGQHISNIGAMLAYDIAEEVGVPAFIADPVSVDEFCELARLSGLAQIPRIALQHTLNIKAVARKVLAKHSKSLQDVNLVVAHIGGGISICPLERGRIIDANNAIQEGPFSPERTGGLPTGLLVDLCYSGKYTHKQMKKMLVGKGGLVSYLGTNNMKELRKRINEGDKEAAFYIEAMAYQIAKEIGAMATVLKGNIYRIIITGGGAHFPFLLKNIISRVNFIAPVEVFPGEHEMYALATSTLRVLKGEEGERQYE